MRTKGSLGSVAIRLDTLNRILKPNAEVYVSKKFHDAISLLIQGNHEPSSGENPILEKEQPEERIAVQAL
jgi:hypothetical protein